MRRAASVALAVLLAAALAGPAACSEASDSPTGIGEPIQVTGGQFIPGELPGTRASIDAGASVMTADGGAPPSLAVKSLGYASTFVSPGMAGKSFSGVVSNDAVAVGIRLADLGTGYWVVPVGAEDSADTRAVDFGASTNFDPGVPAGLHPLRFVALGPNGQGGVESDLSICVGAPIPDNGYLCDPTVQPPGAVFTVQWDTNFDLDIHVITPDGHDLNPKVPFGEAVEAGVHGLPTATLPHVDRDSLAQCAPDGKRQEDVIFPEALTPGTYLVYVDPFAPCGQKYVHFTFTLSRSSGTCPACTFGPILTKSGEILASQVTGGGGPGLFVDQLDVQ